MAEKVSDAEGIKDWKMDINKIEYLSPESSHCTSTGKSSGNSVTGSQVLQPVDESGSSASRSEESLMDPADTIEAAHEAANSARQAAACCRETLAESSSAIKVCRKSIDSAVKKANAAAGREEAHNYRFLAQKYRKAAKCVLDAAYEAGSFANEAEGTADEADEAATRLAEVINVRPEDVGDQQQMTTSITNAAKLAVVDIYKAKYLLLKTMKKCWEEVESEAICRTESTANVSCDNRYRRTCTNISVGVVFILGCVLLSFPSYLKFSPQSKEAILSVGVLMVTTTSAVGLYKLMRYVFKWEKAVERKRRLKIIASIEEDLYTLEDYFDNNGISPVPSILESEE